MATLFSILVFAQTNQASILAIQQGLFSALAAFFRLTKFTKTSKFFGTFACVDGGRIVNWIGVLIKLINASRLVNKAKANVALLFIALSLTACGSTKPAEYPTPVEIATAAVNLTDDALSAAIYTEPEKSWLPSVMAIEAARNTIKVRGDICDALPSVQLVSSAIKCDKCFALISTAKEALSCPQ